MRRFLLIACVFCLFSGLALAQVDYRHRIRTAEVVQAEQKKVVSQWCRLDFEGARLAPDGLTRYAEITTIKALPDVAMFYVVSRYDIAPSPDDSDVLIVTYRVIGAVRRLTGFVAARDVIRVAFRTSERDDQRVVSDVADPASYVGRAAALAWVEQRRAAAPAAEKNIWTRSFDELTALDPSAKKSVVAPSTGSSPAPSAGGEANVSQPGAAAPKSPARQGF